MTSIVPLWTPPVAQYAAKVTREAPTVELLGALEAEERQRRAAGALLAHGCSSGDRVVFSQASSANLICAVLGAARIGVIPVLLNATLTAEERDRLVVDARPSLQIFRPAELAALMDGPQAELSAYPLTRPMHYTSGTTEAAQGGHDRRLGRGNGEGRVRGRGGHLALRWR